VAVHLGHRAVQLSHVATSSRSATITRFPTGFTVLPGGAGATLCPGTFIWHVVALVEAVRHPSRSISPASDIVRSSRRLSGRLCPAPTRKAGELPEKAIDEQTMHAKRTYCRFRDATLRARAASA